VKEEAGDGRERCGIRRRVAESTSDCELEALSVSAALALCTRPHSALRAQTKGPARRDNKQARHARAMDEHTLHTITQTRDAPAGDCRRAQTKRWGWSWQMKNAGRRVFDPEVDVRDKRAGPGCAQLEGNRVDVDSGRHGRPPAVDDPLLIAMTSRTTRVGSCHV
jgi:hypothetical protein